MDQKTLIDKAARSVASESELARQLGVSAGNVNDWRHERRACPVKYIRAMALMLGLDVARTIGEVELARLGEVGQRPPGGVVATLSGLVVGVVALGAAVSDLGRLCTMYRLSTRK